MGGGTRHASALILLVEATQVMRGATGMTTGVRASGTPMAADPQAVRWSTPGSPRRSGAASFLGSSSTGRMGTPNAPRIFCDPGGRALHHIAGRGGSVSLADDADHGGAPRRVNSGVDCERPCLICYRGRDGCRVGLRGAELLGTGPQLLRTARSTLPSWDVIGDLFPPPSLRCGIPA